MSSKLGIYSKTDIIFLIHIFIIITLHSAFVHSEPTQTTSQLVSFKCPEQFGYYADDKNCSKYFVCVFGEALHESCTGGLRFSSELQTCDWPRNVVCLADDSKPNTFRNEEINKNTEENNSDIYDYNEEEIRPLNNNQNDESSRYIQEHYEDLLNKNNANINSNNNPINLNNDNNDDYSLDLQRSRSVLSNSQEINYGTIGRSVSGNRQTVVSTTASEPTISDTNSPNNPIQTEPQKNNRVTVEDLHNPNFDEAIAAIIDENGGVHLNDGPGSLFSLVNQDNAQPGQEVNVYVKQLNTELRANTRRGVAQNPIILINRTQLSTQPTSRTSNHFQQTQRQPQQHFFPHHQVISTSVNFRDSNTKPQEPQRPNTRSPRQRIHIIVNNRTTVQEIPIEDQIDFQRIPAVQTANRYSNARTSDNRRQPPTITTQTLRTTTTPTPRVTTESRARVIPETPYLTGNERRLINTNPRPVAAQRPEYIQPEIIPVRTETIPQRPPPQYRTPEPYSNAVKCNDRSCRLPDCYCGGTEIPGGLPVTQVPQIVLITFDDAINDINWHIYEELFNGGRTNPNGCPIKGTFYVSHEWTDYGQVQTLYSRGHEMASHSVTHSFGERFSKSQWFKEINGQRDILHLYGGVNLEDIRGMRAPFLQGGGNKQFEMLYEANFTYDSTMPVFENDPPFWPYTLDYAINHECMIAPCPTKSFPGFWEIGMVMWQDLRGGRCSMGDACSNPTDENGVYEMIMKNFNRHYQSNRAPFGLYYHSAWFNTDHHKRGFIRVIDELLKKKDVYFMTKWQLIQWMRNPKSLTELYDLNAWQCGHSADRPPPCLQPNICNVGSKSGSRFLKTCQPCPHTYPWVGNTGFAKS